VGGQDIVEKLKSVQSRWCGQAVPENSSRLASPWVEKNRDSKKKDGKTVWRRWSFGA